MTHTLDKMGLEAVIPILSYYHFMQAILIFSSRTWKHSIPTTRILDLKSGNTKCGQLGMDCNNIGGLGVSCEF